MDDKAKSATSPIALTHSRRKGDSKVALSETENTELVVVSADRVTNAQNLAEAWGLTGDANGDDSDESREDGHTEISGRGGLGTYLKSKDDKSLEARINQSRTQKLSRPKAKQIELSEWAEDNDEGEVTRSNAAKQTKRPRVSRLFDRR